MRSALLGLQAFRRFLRFFFKHLYTTLAWGYDRVAWLVSVGQWNMWVLSAAERVRGGPTLELGFGPGHLLLKGVREGWAAAGIDPSRQMAAIAAQRLRAHGHAPVVVRGLAQQLPFPSHSFQHVLSTFPDEYIAAPESLREMQRVLIPGGSVVVVAMGEITGLALLDRLAALLFRLTGQAGPIPDHWSEPVRKAGLRPQLQTVELPRSRVTQIIGTKES